MLVNMDTWKSLNDAQKKVSERRGACGSKRLDSENDALIKAERDKQAAAGIQPIDLGPAAAGEFLAKANEVGWAFGDQALAGEWREAPATGGELDRGSPGDLSPSS